MTRSQDVAKSRKLRRFGMSGDADLTKQEAIGSAVRHAFPLPESGAFMDLLAALQVEPQH